MPQNGLAPSQSIVLLGLEHADLHQQGIERAVSAEHLPHADRADERRQNHRHEHERGEQLFAGEFEAVRQEGERQRDEQRGRGGRDREEEGVAQAFEVNLVAEDLAEKAKVNPSPSKSAPPTVWAIGQRKKAQKTRA